MRSGLAMRVVFMGTPAFALPTLQALIDQHEVVAVVTQPDRKQGRGQKLQPPPVKQLAIEYTIPVWQPERLRKDPETLAALAATEADVFVVVAYGQILPPEVLAMPPRGCINVHGSLLPAYRGAAPIQWAIANGETETGITTMLMDAGLDTGAMLLKAKLPITLEQTAADLMPTLAALGAELLIETLATNPAPIPQDDAQSSYAPLLKPEHFRVDWQRPALAIHNQVRGFQPNCFCLDPASERLKVLQTYPLTDSLEKADEIAVGTITRLLKHEGFAVQTGAGELLLKSVQPAGKKAQSAWDYVNGARLSVGTVLG